MDPNQNLVPGVDPNALGASPVPTPTPAPGPVLAPDPALAAPLAPEPVAAPTLGDNPAATIADAALAGATSVVTTTDLNATDVAPAPTLQAPAEDTGPVSLAPSADFQMGEVSTVSAVQNGADGNLAAATDNEVMIGQPLEPENPMDNPDIEQLSNVGNTTDSESETTGQGAADFNDPDAIAAAEAAAAKKSKDDEEEDEEPIVAAAPVPGSIGSAKSYADIQRAEAEKAAKVAAKGDKGGIKLSKNVIIGIVIGVIAIIGIIVGVFVLTSGNSKPAPTKTSAPLYSYDDDDDEEDQNVSTLSCKRNLAPEEYASYGAVSGTQENIFYFKDEDETLNGLATNFAYTYANQSLTNFWRDKLAADYGVVPNAEENDKNGETEEPDMEEEDDDTITPNKKKTTAEMLHHYVTTKNFTVTHGMEIKSEDIEDWLESDAYSDVTYGASENGAAAPLGEDEEPEETTTTVVRNLKYYNRLQNSIDYTCSISKGY